MAEEIQNGQKPNESKNSRELLAKSAALKEKAALLKERMDVTAKTCSEFLKKEEKDSASEENQAPHSG
jgi:hypothetical protein